MTWEKRNEHWSSPETLVTDLALDGVVAVRVFDNISRRYMANDIFRAINTHDTLVAACRNALRLLPRDSTAYNKMRAALVGATEG